MYNKYFCWSFDDGLEQDKKIVEILKKYKMGATFHLNSGMFGDKTYEGRILNLGMTETPADKFDISKKHLLNYVPHFRLSREEAKELYADFEVAAHTAHHKNLAFCEGVVRRQEVEDDLRDLGELFERPIVGLAYPYGVGAKATHDLLKELGVKYARQMKVQKDFKFPDDPLYLGQTGWHLSKDIFEKLNSFFAQEPTDDDMFFLMFAHGYEFDFDTKESNWDKFEQICETVSSQKDIICCSISEALSRHALRT